MQRLSAKDVRRRRIALLLILPFLATVAFVGWLPGLLPAWAAAGGGGVHGTFTAEWERCPARGTCTTLGRWQATGSAESRADVEVDGAGRRLQPGDRVLAFDTGDPDHVFHPGGGRHLAATVGVLLGVAAVAAWMVVVVWAAMRWAQQRARARR